MILASVDGAAFRCRFATVVVMPALDDSASWPGRVALLDGLIDSARTIVAAQAAAQDTAADYWW